jgi:PKD repeat protein
MRKILLTALAASLCSITAIHGQVNILWQTTYSRTDSFSSETPAREGHVIDKKGNLYIAGDVFEENSSGSLDSVKHFASLLKYKPGGGIGWEHISDDGLFKEYSYQNLITDGSAYIYPFGNQLSVYGIYTQTTPAADIVQLDGTYLGQFGSYLPYDCSICQEFAFMTYTPVRLRQDNQKRIYQVMTVDRQHIPYSIVVALRFYPRNALWQVEFSDKTNKIEASEVQLNSRNDMYITGRTYFDDADSLSADLFLAKIDSGGHFEWMKKYNAESGIYRNTTPAGMALDDSGFVYIAANVLDSTGMSTALFLKYDSSGKQLFAKNIFGGEYLNVKVNSIKRGPGNTFLFAGILSNTGYGKQFVIEYNTGGAVVWKAVKSQSSGDLPAVDLATDRYKNVYVLAEADADIKSDMMVTKYNPAGKELWSKVIDEAWFDVPEQISADDSGYLYISGNSYDTGFASHIIAARLAQVTKAGFTYEKDCSGKVTFSNHSSAAADMSYSWDFGDGKTSTDENPAHNFLPGKYAVQLSVTSSGNTDNYIDSIYIAPLPDASFGYTSSGRKHYLFAKDTTLTDYIWVINGKDTLRGKKVSFLTQIAGEQVEILLIVTNSEGCTNSGTGTIYRGIEEFVEAGSLKLYPNPLTGNSVLSFTLTHPSRITMTATDATGRIFYLVRDAELNAGDHTLPLNGHFAAGPVVINLWLDGKEKASIKAVSTGRD